MENLAPQPESPKTDKFKTPWWLKILLPLASLFICAASFEIVARIWEYNLAQSPQGWEQIATRRIRVVPSNNPDINAYLAPNTDYFWEGIPVHINSQYIRDDEYSYDKPAGTFRVLSLGDSVTFGWEVHLEDSYSKKLEQTLKSDGKNVQVIDAGVVGWDQPIELAYLKETGVRYQPDVIIGAVTVINDINHDVYHIEPLTVVNWLQQNTYSWYFMTNIYHTLHGDIKPPPTDLDVQFANPEPFPLDESDPIWDTYVRTPLTEMAEQAKQHNAKFIVLIVPLDAQVQFPDFPTQAQDVIAKLGQDQNFPVVDLLPVYRDAFAKMGLTPGHISPLYADYASHPSALGHQLAAEALYKAMVDNGYIPQ